jgi:pimeloyl-ACP methyl ester carboxylesterase
LRIVTRKFVQFTTFVRKTQIKKQERTDLRFFEIYLHHNPPSNSSKEKLPAPQSGRAKIQNGTLYYETCGSPTDLPVVLIHAGFLDSRMWDEQFDLFANEGFRIIRYDMRGSGKSERPAKQFDDARDLRQLLKFLQIDRKISIVGVSNGGSTAIDFALEYPEIVRCLVLVAPTVNGYEYGDSYEEKLDRTMDKEWEKWTEAIKNDRIEEAIEIHLGIMAPALGKDTKAKIVRVALDNYHIFKEPLDELRIKRDPPAFKRLSEIRAPTLLVWGDRDYPGQITIAERVQSFIPSSKRILIHGADHLVNLSQPQAFNRVVLDFLKSQKA